MYAYIRGKIISRNDSQLVIENNGIGYLINCPFAISADLGHNGEEATVYVYQSVREDDISLYGFASSEQKEIFLKLITVSGIGPKVAHNICSALTPEQIALAVMGNNVSILSSVKGLGKKTAEKIIIELRDKLKGQTKSGSTGSASVISATASSGAAASAMGSIADDAIGALMVLDYREQDAAEAVAAAYEEGITLEVLIKKALKIASGSKFS